MGHSEFVEWMAFYNTEPFGEGRSDIQTATLAATIVNANRSKKSKPVSASKFLVDWWKDKSKPQALAAKFRAVAGKPVTKPKTNGTRVRDTGSRVSR